IDLTGNAVLSGGILKNNATFKVGGTGNALDGETITNSAAGTIEVLANGALTIDQGSTVANTGNVTVDATGKLTVSSATISGVGTVTDNGEIDLIGNAVLSGGILKNNAAFKVSGAGNALDGETITNSAAGTIEVLANGALTIDQGSTVANTGNVTVDATGKLTVNGATISGVGTVTDNGEIDLIGNAVLSGGILKNNATFKVSGTGNALDTETITNSAAGTIEVLANGALTIDQGSSVTNTGNVTVDATGKLTVNGATISGAGTVTDNGEIDLTGNAVLSGGILKSNATFKVSGTGNALDGETITNSSTGTIEVVANGALTIDQGSTVANTGNVIVDENAALTLNDATISGGAIKGAGTIDVTGASKIDGAATVSISTITADAKLTLDGVTVSGSVITDNFGIELDNTVKLKDGATIKGGPVTNNGTLQIAGAATLLNDVLTNSGHAVAVDDNQTLTLSGTEITGGTINNFSGVLGGKIDVTGNSKIDGNATLNQGTVKVESGVTLTLDDATVAGAAITNGGTVKVDTSKKLTLAGASLTGGTLTVVGTLASSGTTTITDANISNGYLLESTLGGLLALVATTPAAAITNGGIIRANGAELDINGEAVANTGTLGAINHGTLKLIGMAVTNTGSGDVSVESGSTLDLQGATIDGGTVTIAGTLESTGTSAIDSADITVANAGTISVTSGTLTIDPGLAHAITNHGLIKAVTGGTLKLATASVTNTGASITVDGTSKLYLTDVSINGGSLSNAGNLYSAGLDTVTGSVTNTGTIEVQGGTLNLSGGLSGVGTLIIDDTATLELAGATAQTVTFAGGADTLQLDKVAGQGFTGTITGQSSKGGTFTITGAADITTSSGDALDFTATGGTQAKPADIILTPTGALTGAANGIVVTQNGTGAISLTATKDIKGLNGDGITLRDSATGIGDITVNNVTGKASGTGANSTGILVENLNSANGGDISITQLAGVAGGAYGIDALTQGGGDIAVHAGGTITGSSIYGIRARSYGAGSEIVTTDAGSVINSGSSGIVAVNRATSLGAASGSSITVNAYGAIHSGSSLNQSGNTPAGIQAGYNGATTGSSANTNVNGNVVVNNHANVTAAAGYGIHAYNYGNGDVTVSDAAGTTIVGAEEGIRAQALGGGTGDVTVTLGANASVTGTTSYGILAYSIDAGDISVTLANGDSIISGSSGIVAVNYAAAITSDVHSTISVEAHGTIHSGSALNNDGTTPGAIIAGYKPDGISTFSNAVNGDVSVTSDATITADAGYGIEAFTWAAGDITVTTGTGSSVTATAGTAIGAFDHGGGDVSVTNEGTATGTVGLAALANGAGDVTIVNHGNITSTSLAGISVTQNEAGATGSTHITNSGSIVAPSAYAAIFIQENATGSATIDNSGTIGPAIASTVTSTTYAIVETGGAITINNTGHINGNISVASATFNNNAGGTWTVSGSGVFGNASSIVNHGDIDLHGASISGSGLSIENHTTIDSWGTASISGAITNTGAIEVHDGALTLFGSLSGSGSVTVDAGALLKLDGSVTQTVNLAGDGAKLQIDTSTFGGSIGELSATDTIDLSIIKYDGGTSATYDSVTGNLIVSDLYGHTITLKLVGADYSNAHFAGSSDGHGGTLVTFNAADDAPHFNAAQVPQSTGFSELLNTTGSATTDPAPAATGTIDFSDVDLTERPTATVAIADQTVTWFDTDHATHLTLTAGETAALEQALTLQTTGKNNGTVGWSYSIADGVLDFLGEGQTAKVVSTVTLDDHQGKTDTAEVTVTITGKNDAPTLAPVSTDPLVDTATHDSFASITGTLVGTDADHGETATLKYAVQDVDHLAVPTVAGLYGSLTVNDDGSYDYVPDAAAINALSAGPYSDVFTIQTKDAYGATGTASFTVAVTGANDTPVLSDGSLGTLEDTAAADSFSGLTGQLTGTDVDTGDTLSYALLNADHHPTGTVTGHYGSLTVNTDGSYSYVPDAASINALPQGSYSDSFTVQLTDAHGAVTTATYTVDLTGANDTPTLSDVNIGTLTDTAATDTFSSLTGTLAGTDADTGETATLTYAVQNADIHGTATGYYGALTVNADGSYSYVPNAAAINALSAGDYLDTFTVQTTDAHNAIGMAILTVDVTGANDAPVVDVGQISVTHDGAQVTVHGISVTDADAAANETFTLVASGSGSNLSPASTSDTLAYINSALQTVTYTDASEGAAIQTVTLTVADSHSASNTVSLLFGTAGRDDFIGTGHQDQFVFAASSNNDTVTNFTSGQDHIDLSSVVTTSDTQAWLDQHATASGADTLITINASDTILLKGVAHVQASDFIVHA
ncbi:VCBS domain-containing protein, partial [Bradyrhizobium sp. 21]|uniref:VCBS domain-containing protein n=1 Tax=Bradyrhizobium sp. 21 TaxID=2782666 RepID=UPI001FFA314F